MDHLSQKIGFPLNDSVVQRSLLTGGMLASKLAINLGYTGGHHANSNEGAGFCVFNDSLVPDICKKKDMRRILILDLDYQGNGTADIFKDDNLPL